MGLRDASASKKMKLDLVGSALCNEVMKLCIGEQWLVLGGSESV